MQDDFIAVRFFKQKQKYYTAKLITVLLDAVESTKNYIIDLKLFTVHCKIFQPREAKKQETFIVSIAIAFLAS
jgi:hypothetical protein